MRTDRNRVVGYRKKRKRNVPAIQREDQEEWRYPGHYNGRLLPDTKHQPGLKALSWDREKRGVKDTSMDERTVYQSHKVKLKAQRTKIAGELKSRSEKDGVVLSKNREDTRLVETSAENIAGLFTWRLPLSLCSMPIPSDRNITGRKLSA